MKFSVFFATAAATLLASPLHARPSFINEAPAVAARATAETNETSVAYPEIETPVYKALVKDFAIHESCNATQTLQLRRGFADLEHLLSTASEHILLYGNESSIYQTYFGAGSNPIVPLGLYLRVLQGDKSSTLFRCDDPDRNCETQTGYNGHWRGENATGETVICPLGFQTRLSLDKACSEHFSLVKDNVNVYWATDLLHRTMHLPALTNGLVGHVADEYAAQLDIAKTDVSQSVLNQHSLQSFAFEAFVRKYVDNEGCPADRGEEEEEHDHDHDHDHQDGPDASAPDAQASGQDCHTHGDGTVHCS